MKPTGSPLQRISKKRDKSDRSSLDDIPGIGPGRKKLLLRHFGSLKELSSASLNDLELIKGISKKMAKSIWLYFKNTVMQTDYSRFDYTRSNYSNPDCYSTSLAKKHIYQW